MPTAAIAVKSSHREASLKNVAIWAGIRCSEFNAASTRNTTTKVGSNGGLLPSLGVWAKLRMTTEATKTTGANSATRINFTKVAVSPVGSEIENPAPTTCATS